MSRESLKNKKNRIAKIISILKNEYPDSKCSLVYDNPFQLLVATILSAQCTDERVNKVTSKIFPQYCSQQISPNMSPKYVHKYVPKSSPAAN